MSRSLTIGIPNDDATQTTVAAVEASQQVNVGGHNDALSVNVPTPHGPAPVADPNQAYVDANGVDVTTITKMNQPPLVRVKGIEMPLSDAVLNGLVTNKAASGRPAEAPSARKVEPQVSPSEIGAPLELPQHVIDGIEDGVNLAHPDSNEVTHIVLNDFVGHVSDGFTDEEIEALGRESGMSMEDVAETLLDNILDANDKAEMEEAYAKIGERVDSEALEGMQGYIYDSAALTAMTLAEHYQMTPEDIGKAIAADEVTYIKAALMAARGDQGRAMTEFLLKHAGDRSPMQPTLRGSFRS